MLYSSIRVLRGYDQTNICVIIPFPKAEELEQVGETVVLPTFYRHN